MLLFFFQFEPGNVLKMFLSSHETRNYQSALFVVVWYQVTCDVLARLTLQLRTRYRGNKLSAFGLI